MMSLHLSIIWEASSLLGPFDVHSSFQKHDHIMLSRFELITKPKKKFKHKENGYKHILKPSKLFLLTDVPMSL